MSDEKEIISTCLSINQSSPGEKIKILILIYLDQGI